MKNARIALLITALAATAPLSTAVASWYLQQKIPPPQTVTYPPGWAIPVAISGDRCIMSTFVDGENAFRAGAVYVYRFDAVAWVQEQKLQAADAQEDEGFGFGADIDGDTIIIGAPGDDDNGPNVGSAYVFQHNGSQWVQTQKLMPLDGEHTSQFGYSVAVSGGVCAIGAWDLTSAWPSVLYEYRREDGRWQEMSSMGFESQEVGGFWGSVAIIPESAGIFGGIVFGVSGDDLLATNAGAAHLSFGPTIYPPAPTPNQFFGSCVAYGGGVLAVSAPSDGGSEACIYVYRNVRDSMYPMPEQKLNIPVQDKHRVFDFGKCLGVNGDTLVTTAFKFVEQDPPYADAIVYVYEYNGSIWMLKDRFEASDSRQDTSLWRGSSFPWPVAINGNAAVLGAPSAGWGDGMVYMYRRCPTADVTGDCLVDLTDFGVLAEQWLTGFCPWPGQ